MSIPPLVLEINVSYSISDIDVHTESILLLSMAETSKDPGIGKSNMAKR